MYVCVTNVINLNHLIFIFFNGNHISIDVSHNMICKIFDNITLDFFYCSIKLYEA